MYVLVERHLSSIDKGIQAAHAIANYSQILQAQKNFEKRKNYLKWIKNDKTIILLNGGTAIELEEIYNKLIEKDIYCKKFVEPDLNNLITAIAILVDERVYNKEKYPDYDKWKTPSAIFQDFFLKMSISKENEIGKDWVKFIGGENNAFLRQLLTTKQLAR